MNREDRYLVLKRKDIAAHLSNADASQLAALALKIANGRERAGKIPLECVVVESDWPEYEVTWGLIADRMKKQNQSDVEIDGFHIAVWTNDYAEPPCVAVNMTVALHMLEGYDLTDEEKTSVSHLMAGYCRLIDERRLTGFGETEFEAIADLFSKAKKVPF